MTKNKELQKFMFLIFLQSSICCYFEMVKRKKKLLKTKCYNKSCRFKKVKIIVTTENKKVWKLLFFSS